MGGRARRGGRWASAAGLVLVVAGWGAGSAGATPRGASGFGSNWTVYHGNALSTGVDGAGTTLRPMQHAWTSPALDGSLFGEPLVYGGRVVIATTNDTIYELSAHSGDVLWHRHYATAVPQGKLPCGDVGPTVGFVGTPVIDPSRSEIFAVADVYGSNGSISHHLFGVNLYTGAVELNEVADVPGRDPAAELQRPGLNLDKGQVVIGFGGNDGDCGNYSGAIIAVPEAGGAKRTYAVEPTASDREGAVWQGGGSPLVDSSGNIWFATGNGSQTSSPYDFSDSVTELSPTLAREQYFAPSDWASQNASDADLGSAAPAFVDGYVFQVGKAHVAYLLNPSHLGGIGGQLATLDVCSSTDPHGGLAVQGSTVYVGCKEGVWAVAVHSGSPPSMSVLWKTNTGAGGPPIVAGGLVWSIDQSGTLFGLDPSNGNGVVQESTNGVDTSFPTPAVADGLMLVPAHDAVYAYKGPAGVPPSPAGATPYWVATANGGVYSFGGATPFGSLLGKPLHQPIVGMASTPGGHGYWLVASDGGVFAFGNAHFYGSEGGKPLTRPIVGMAGTSDGHGYWLVASDGGVFAFGDARFRGSMGGRHLNKPVVGMASQPAGSGYWLVASDGGIFAFGGANFDGSTGGMHLKTSITGMAASRKGGGYWLVAADGGVFAFLAHYHGSLGGSPVSSPVVAISGTADGGGYLLADQRGGVYGFGNAVPVGGAPAGAAATVAVDVAA